jgi:leucyl/phenylalanyl-tRNA--protein transferase
MFFRLLPDNIIFPDPALADDDGLLAVGGDLSPERLMLAYKSGIFPWFSEDDPILWYAPHERCVVFPDKVKVSKSMAKLLRSGSFSITWDTAFEEVIGSCSALPRKDQDGTWITPEMKAAYIRLHELGIAHSVEVWHQEELAGGLYGIIVNHVFCGESMFSKMPNASKAAFISLCRSEKFKMIDCQVPNDHLLSLGAELISREDYLAILQVV